MDAPILVIERRYVDLKIKKILSVLDNIEEYIISFLFTILLGLVGYVVFARYFFSYTPSWAEQVARIIFVRISFLGISLAAKYNMHLRVVAITQFLSEKTGKVIIFIGEMVAMVVAFVLAYRIFIFTMLIYSRGQTFAAMPDVPVWIMYIAGAVGMFGMGMRLLINRLLPAITKGIDNIDATSNEEEVTDPG